MLIKTLINNTWYQSPNVAVGAYDTWFGSSWTDWGEPDERQWHLYKVKIKQGYQEFYMDNQLIKTNNYVFSNPIFQELALSSKGQSYWEWITVYTDYDNISIFHGSEESLIPQKYPIISKESSFGIKIYENTIYGFVNTTNGYKEISTGINLNEPYFIALTYDGYYLKLYINGSLANYTYVQGSVLQNLNNLSIDFKGIIDELRIYNVSLSENRILEEFYRKLEKEIPYYLEEGTSNTQNTIVYVRLPYLSNETIYMYYCNPYALSKSNGTEVFDFYDNFTYLKFDWYPYKTYPWTTWSGVNPTGWTADNGTLIHIMSISDAHQLAIYNISFGNDIYETAINLGTLESIEEAGIAWNVHTDGSLYYVRAIYYPLSGRVGWELIKESPGGVSALAANYTGLTGNTWYYLRILYKNGYIYAYISQDLVNWSLVLSAIDATSLPPGYFGLHSGFSLGVSHMYRWIRIRKYIEPWPSYSFGAEETC